MLVVVCYDVETIDPAGQRRLRQVAKTCKDYGQRVQFSVFECFISLEEMRQLHEKVKKFVVPAEDNVRFYWMFAEAMSMTLTIGSEKPMPPPNYYVI